MTRIRTRNIKRKIVLATAIVETALCLSGCSLFGSRIQEIKGDIAGAEYTANFYTNDGENFMTMHGEQISLSANAVKEYDYDSSSYYRTMSSVVTITIDGHEVENCGSTVVFAEEGLGPDVEFDQADVASVDSSSDRSVGSATIVARTVNRVKNAFGKSRVVVIQSQQGDPICAYSGDSVYYEVCDDLPKTTKLYVDGKALYIHRANFQILDAELLDS